MNINHISASLLNTFIECPMKYRFRYHEKRRAPESPSAQFGKWIHKALEISIKERKDLQTVLKEELEGYPFPRKYLSRVPQIVKNIKTKSKLLINGETEVKFELPFFETIKVRGVIDLIQKKEDQILVLDYKTSLFEKSRQDLQQDIQLRLYSYAAQKITQLPNEHINVALFYLDSGNILSTTYTTEEINRFVEQTLEVIDRIISTPPVKAIPKPSKACYYCEFRKLCPIRK